MTFVLPDPWAGKSLEQLKADCRRLSREVGKVTHLLMAAVANLPKGHLDIPEPDRSEVWRRISYAATDEYFEKTGASRPEQELDPK